MRVMGIAAPVAAVLLLAGCASGPPVPWHPAAWRIDYAPVDAPYSNVDLIRNFALIAFNLEPMFGGGEISLARWDRETPLTYSLAVSAPGGALRDVRAVEQHIEHLERVTGLHFVFEEDPDKVKLWVLIISRDELRDTVAYMKSRGEDNPIYGAMKDFLDTNPRYNPCRGIFFTNEQSVITGGIAMIRDELEEPLRTSCIVEEVTQLMGLPNDDDSVRPSIFNDDAEFGALTEHDEFLLRILYDNDLRPGMTAAEARPLVERIVARLRPAGA